MCCTEMWTSITPFAANEMPACSVRRVDRQKYQIQIPLPAKIDPSVTMMTVEEKPDVTYSDLGGCKEQIEKMREVSNITQAACTYLEAMQAGCHCGAHF